MLKKLKVALIIFPIFLQSCFKADEAVPPYVPPFEVETMRLEKSMYSSQAYIDFSSASVVSENQNDDWTLSFDCAQSGFNIRLNTASYMGIARTGKTAFDSVYTNSASYIWEFDKSDGNQDSLAIDKWVSFDGPDPIYSNEVFLLGQNDGIDYILLRKFKFIEVTEAGYRFLVSGPEEIVGDTILVVKDSVYNCIHYNYSDNTVFPAEPAKENWDLLFTQYQTILFTDDGIRTSYFVRGVLQNPYLVETSLDTVNHFLDISLPKASANTFHSTLDFIGHDWKSVSVDQASNSAEYKVRPGYTYLVKDGKQHIYKFRFQGYFSPEGIKGYPSLEFARLD